jgi:hypothetical protein
MKLKIVLCLFAGLLIASVSSRSYAQVKVVGDTTFITGGNFAGTTGDLGLLDSVIDNDTTATGARRDPKTVYALYEGQVYYQLTPIYYYNPTGCLTIVGVPDPNHPSAKAKPIILLQPTGTVDVAAGKVYGSIKFVNIHCQVMEMDGKLQSEYFYCGTANKLKQTLKIDNCFFEFSNTDIFDCTNESGAIGGWPYGAAIYITNSYFRNMFEPSQWWSSRVFQCKHPTDTLWVENSTFTSGGLTFLQQNELTDFCYINHNTIVNQKKYWLLSPYRHNEFITNNIFVNQNWVGEDTNVTNSGQDPDKLFMSTINIDTNNATNGEVVEPMYQNADSTPNQSLLGFAQMRVYVSNNINYFDPLLTTDYYQSSNYILADTGTAPNTGAFNAIPSYLHWFYNWTTKVGNMPGEWMNSRTKALFTAWAPPTGGFVEQNTITTQPQTATSVALTASLVDAMAQWNQSEYGDPRYKTPSPVLTSTAYIYGDYLPTTLPGIVGGAKTDAITQATTLASTDQVGISKFTDLTENFYQTANVSTIDGLPIGSLIWNDAQNASYPGGWKELAVVENAYNSVPNLPTASKITAVTTRTTGPQSFALSQNYPNPFNPTTQISYSVKDNGFVTLKVYNILGQEVATLFAGQQTSGQHFVTFDGSKLSSGVYLYRLQEGSNSMTMKMMLVK